MLSTGKCKECERGFYLLLAPLGNVLCKECLSPQIAECDGGNRLYPKPGFWRSSIFSDNVMKCRNDEACIGKNPPEYNLIGACNDGY